ncbi:dUTP diphosphatase [Ancylobacter sp. VNQ12]|uniref:dUTP diphosphatase n=1 Tax=Ancylobacter sp. VNQ12 TaxID=3400920 RepID=UPI003C0713F9
MSIAVAVLVLPHGEGLPLPDYATAGSAGLDLIAALPEGAPLTLGPLARAAVPTGLCLALPEGFEAQVRPRSGLALKQGLTVLNAPGTVDADYRGEVKVLLVNLGDSPVQLERGQRVAQLVVAPVTRIQLVRTGNLEETTRGSGGFGSTGLDGRAVSR